MTQEEQKEKEQQTLKVIMEIWELHDDGQPFSIDYSINFDKTHILRAWRNW